MLINISNIKLLIKLLDVYTVKKKKRDKKRKEIKKDKYNNI